MEKSEENGIFPGSLKNLPSIIPNEFINGEKKEISSEKILKVSKNSLKNEKSCLAKCVECQEAFFCVEIWKCACIVLKTEFLYKTFLNILKFFDF